MPRLFEIFWRIAPGFRCPPPWSSVSPTETDEDDGSPSRLAADVAAGTPTAAFWSYTNVGWRLLGRVIETVTEVSWAQAMRSHLADSGMRQMAFGCRRSHDAARNRARGHRQGPSAGRAVGRACVRTGRNDRRLDGHRPASVCGPAPRGPVTRRHAHSTRRDLDPRLAGCLVSRLGQVRLGGWPGLGLGRRRPRRAVRPADRAGASRRRRADDQRQHRARDVPLALRRPDGVDVRDQRHPAAVSTQVPELLSTSRASRASTHGQTGGWRSRLPEVACGSRASRVKPRHTRSMTGPSSWTLRIRTTPR